MAAEPSLWLASLRRLAVASALGHLIWETLQLPLYTIWLEGTAGQIAFAVVHCTAGDLAITASGFIVALIVWGQGWPGASVAYHRVMWGVVAIGVAYAFYSEWANVGVRGAWAYSNWMPRVPPLGTGLAPLLQWIVVPLVSFMIVRRRLVEEVAGFRRRP